MLPAAIVTIAALAPACGGGSTLQPPDAQGTAVGTATPYARPPAPIIVTPAGAAGGGGATGPVARETAYKVEAGDTLLAIANRFETTVEAIVRRNNLANAAEIRIGQELVIPTGPAPAAAATPATTARPTSTVAPAPRTATPSATGGQTYTVVSGDTASGIASRFGVTVDDLATANNTTVASLASLQIGDRLTIPPRR